MATRERSGILLDLLEGTRCYSGHPSNHTPCLLGGRELDWRRNYLSLLTALLTPEQMPGTGCHSTPSRASATAKFTGPKGKLLWEEQRGCTPFGPPCTMPYLFPLARNLLCFSSANPLRLYVCRYRHPPMGGGEGTRPCLLHFFYLGTTPDKSLLFSFSLLAFLTAFFHTRSLCSLKPGSSGSVLESTRI